jgi:hypothetical protein
MPYLAAPVDLQFFVARHWLTGLAGGATPGWELFQFFQSKAEALPNEDVEGRRGFALLAAACFFDFHPTSRANPFRVMMQSGNSRSAAIVDFGPDDVVTLTAIAASVPELPIRARLADVAWEAGRLCQKKNWQIAVLAARTYAHVAGANLANGDELLGREALQRGLELGWQFRKQAPEILDELWRLVETTARGVADRPMLMLVLADECIERKNALAPTLAPLVEAAAQAHLAAAGPTLYHAELWGRAAKLWAVAGDEAKAKQSRLNGAEGFVAHAEAGAGNAMFAAHWMKVGLEALRQSGADRARISEIHERLLALQQASTGELKHISMEIDVREFHEHVMKCVSGKTFEEALFGLVRMDSLARPERIREMVMEQARRSPLSASIAHDLMNSDGLTIGRRGSLLDGSDEEREAALQLATFEHASRWNFFLRGDVLVPRAAQTIYNEHHPTEGDVASYVVGHPYVPAAIQVSVIRGLCFGFEGDWLAAGAYLIPRMEALVRHWMQRKGVITSGVESDGFQAERPLTELFKLPQALEVFGPNLLFELKCHLTEKWGYDLRNKYAHGLAPDGEIASHETLSLWWLLWRVLLTPLLAGAPQAEEAEPDNGGPETGPVATPETPAVDEETVTSPVPSN